MNKKKNIQNHTLTDTKLRQTLWKNSPEIPKLHKQYKYFNLNGQLNQHIYENWEMIWRKQI